MKHLCIVVGITLSLQAAEGQDLKHALQELRKVYAQSDKFHIVMEVAAFEDEQVSQPYYQEQADIRRSGPNYRYRFGNNDMLMNEKYMILVDRVAREIICDTRSLHAEQETFKEMMNVGVLDSILQLYENPKYLGRNDQGIDHYRIHQKSGSVRQVDLFLNSQNSLLQAIHYHYLNKQYVRVRFKTFETQPVFASGTFDERQYITGTKGKIKAALTFKHFTVREVTLP